MRKTYNGIKSFSVVVSTIFQWLLCINLSLLSSIQLFSLSNSTLTILQSLRPTFKYVDRFYIIGIFIISYQIPKFDAIRMYKWRLKKKSLHV